MQKIHYREWGIEAPRYWGLLAVLGAITAVAGFAVLHMEHEGHWVTGMSNQIVWGTPHVFAIFLIVAASGALNVASIGSVFGQTMYKPLARLSGLMAITLLVGGLIVLVLLWRPTQRIRDAMRLLSALADSSLPQRHRELAQLNKAPLLPDEIDGVLSAMVELSRQIHSLEHACTAAQLDLSDSEKILQLTRSVARVASCAGVPGAGIFRVTEGAARIHEALEPVGTWAEFQRLVHPEDRSQVQSAWRRSSALRTMDIEFRLLIDEKVIYLHAMAAFRGQQPPAVPIALVHAVLDRDNRILIDPVR